VTARRTPAAIALVLILAVCALPGAAAENVSANAAQSAKLGCDGYQFHLEGSAPGLPGSSATLDLPPIDNDCDGLFNEDGVNGRDDDGDGEIDEDSGWDTDSFVAWSSFDGALGKLVTGDVSAKIMIMRRRFPTPHDVLGFMVEIDGDNPVQIVGAPPSQTVSP
jgi:hypothetical protein